MRLAVLGDIHGKVDDTDVGQLDAAGYDAILVVGDLAGYRPGSGEAVGRTLARLQTPTYVIPGNHDAATLPQLGAEVTGQRGLADRLAGGMEKRVASLRDALGPARLCAYERVDLGEIQLLVGRPHTFGGPGLSFVAYMARAHGIPDLQASAARLSELVDACDDRPIVVLVHNGPSGLGDRRDDIFGRDFHRDQGDWGDPDLRVALDHARAQGKEVRAVVAGHMHHALSGGGHRQEVALEGGTVLINAARVPRVGRRQERHHVRIELTAEHLLVERVLVSERGSSVRAQARWSASEGGTILS